MGKSRMKPPLLDSLSLTPPLTHPISLIQDWVLGGLGYWGLGDLGSCVLGELGTCGLGGSGSWAFGDLLEVPSSPSPKHPKSPSPEMPEVAQLAPKLIRNLKKLAIYNGRSAVARFSYVATSFFFIRTRVTCLFAFIRIREYGVVLRIIRKRKRKMPLASPTSSPSLLPPCFSTRHPSRTPVPSTSPTTCQTCGPQRPYY